MPCAKKLTSRSPNWGGVSCYDPHTVHPLLVEGQPAPEIRTLHEDGQGRLWMGCGTDSGLWTDLLPETVPLKAGIYQDEQLDLVPVPEGGVAGSCLALCEAGPGSLWLRGAGGLVRYDGHTFQRVAPFNGHLVRALLVDRAGRLVVGSSDGSFGRIQLQRGDGSTFETLYQRETNNWISSLREGSDGTLWFGLTTYGGQWQGEGLGRYRDGDGVVLLTRADGLVDNRVEDLLEDRQGRLWVATWGGVGCWDGTQFRSFTTREGLPNNHVRCLHEDEQGWLWLGTDGGVVVYDGDLFQTLRTPGWVGVNRILPDQNGDFWLATLNGPVRYTPGRVPPRVRCTRVEADRTYPEGEGVDVPSLTHQILFEFKGMSFRTHPQHMLYTYRLQGLEDDWQPVTRQRRAYYHDLPPGHYTFQVQAIDPDLNRSDPAAVAVQVTPDPHLTALQELLSGEGESFVGQSPALVRVQQQLEQVAGSDLTALILGETGTGKGLAARTLHRLSRRQNGPFVPVNCGALPEHLVESELFGHERGSFTGAHAQAGQGGVGRQGDAVSR